MNDRYNSQKGISFILISILITCMNSLSGCDKAKDMDTITFDNIVEFDKFPKTVECGEGDIFGTDCLGKLDFKIQDSLMVITTASDKDGWKIIGLPADSVVGELLTVGHGANELNMIPLVSTTSFQVRDNGIHSLVGDNVSRKFIDIDLTASVDSGKAIMSREDGRNLSHATVSAFKPTDNFEVYVDVDPERCALTRRVYKDGVLSDADNIAMLNSYAVQSMDKIGLLMPRMAINPALGRIVEVMDIYPQINIYAADGSESLTLLPEGKVGRISDFISERPSQNDMIYRTLRSYDDFFAVCRRTDNGAEICFFSWDGNPLLRLSVPEEATSFDIDLANMDLYTLDFHNDSMRRRHIPELRNL